MIKLIIFDWDDVFTIGSKEGYFACYRKALDAVEIKLPEEEFKRRIIERWGQSARREIEHLLEAHPEKVESALRAYLEHLHGDTFINEIKMMPGSVELLHKLKSKYTLALATGIEPENLKKIMQKFSVPHVFTKTIHSSQLHDPKYAKPHAHMIESILNELNISKKHAMMVGDAGNDMRMAQNAGVTPVAVLSGHLSKEQAQTLNVTHIIETVTELPSVLDLFQSKSL